MAPHVSGNRRLLEEDAENPIQFFPSEHGDDAAAPAQDEPLEQPGPIVLKRSSEEREWPPEVNFPRSLLFLVFAVAVGAITVGLVSLLQSRRVASTTLAVNAPRPTTSSTTAPATPSPSTLPGSLVDAPPLAREVAVGTRAAEGSTADGGRVMDAALPPRPVALGGPEDDTDTPPVDPPLGELPELPFTTTRLDLPLPQPPPAAAPPAPPTVLPGDAGSSPQGPSRMAPVLDDRAAIEQLLLNYRDAYRRLDAASAASIFPRVDTRALNRAFSTIVQQDMRFERCSLKLDDQQASALCIGEIEYVQRTGDQSPKTQSLTWTFEFARRSDRWEISSIDAR